MEQTVSKFVPHLFIGIGANYNFFTLRETYLHTSYIPGPGDFGNAVVNGVYQGSNETEVRSFHHFNLSTDADEAFAKATEHAAEMGLELISKREDLAIQMSEIRRANAEELAARARAQAEREAQWALERAQRDEAERADIERGIISFGRKFQGAPKRIEEVDSGYLAWIVKMEHEFEEGSKMRALAVAIRTRFSHLLPRTPERDLFVGEEGKREVFSVEVLRVHTFHRPAFGAPWRDEAVHIVTFITPEGACLVSKGSFRAVKGETMKIKATVKQHDRYEGQAQTVIQRIAVVAE